MLVALLAVALAVSPPLTPVSPRLINVAGDAVVTFPANQLLATFHLTAKDRDVPGARKAADVKLRAVEKVLASAGIDGRRIIVHDTGPLAEYRGNEVVGQNYTRTVVVTVTDLSKLEDLLAAAMKAAGVPTCNLMLRSSEVKTYEVKARVAAAAVARDRASNLVETLGGKLGLPRSVTDHSSGSQGTANAIAVLTPEGTASVNLVDLQVSSTVAVQFDIRDEG